MNILDQIEESTDLYFSDFFCLMPTCMIML
nr:MAG TPA: hypothetical protein [Caudoviricetes sp.]